MTVTPRSLRCHNVRDVTVVTSARRELRSGAFRGPQPAANALNCMTAERLPAYAELFGQSLPSADLRSARSCLSPLIALPLIPTGYPRRRARRSWPYFLIFEPMHQTAAERAQMQNRQNALHNGPQMHCNWPEAMTPFAESKCSDRGIRPSELDSRLVYLAD